MTNQRERISGVDTAWLRMEHPTNLMMIVGVMTFAERLSAAAVKRIVRERFLAFSRFACKATQDAAGAWWESGDRVDLDYHVKRVRLPDPGGKAELEALVSDLASTALDPAKPLWQFHVVENHAGGSALVARIHHCYADGIALIQVVLSLTHESAEGSLALPKAPVRGEPRGDADFWEQMLKPFSGVLGSAGKVGRGLLEQGRGLAANPQAAAGAVQEFARKGMDFATEVARLALMGPDSATRLKGPLGTRKRVAWAEPLPLAEVKVVGKALGCSINDVLLSFAAGSIRDYLEARGHPVAGLEIRAVVPVNLRPPGEGHNLGNHFGMVFLELPVGIAHPLERLYEVRSRMKALKGSYQPIIALALLNAVGYGPKALQEQVTTLLGNSATAVMTNVPGPQQPLYFAGKRIVDIDFWVPQSGGIGMGVSILSYDGRIHFGVITDEGLVPDPDAIVSRFGEEFEKLLWLTLMSPWGEDAIAALEAGSEGATADAVPAQTGIQAPKKRARRKGRIGASMDEPAPAKVPKRFRNL